MDRERRGLTDLRGASLPGRKLGSGLGHVGEEVAVTFHAIEDVVAGEDELLGLVAGADLAAGDGCGHDRAGAAT